MVILEPTVQMEEVAVAVVLAGVYALYCYLNLKKAAI